MRHSVKTKWQLRLANAVFVVLFLCVVGLLHWLSRTHHYRFDLTANQYHSLSETSIALLARLNEPLHISAFVSQSQSELRSDIRALIQKYQKHKPDIELVFVDPNESPDKARVAGIDHEGALIITYSGGMEKVSRTRLNEETITNTLVRLGQRGERWIVFLSGHGERSSDREANFDLSIWANELRKRGFKTRTLALSERPQIPANTTALIIAGPRLRFLGGEVKQIQKYIDNGGNLLWLADPGPLHGLEPIAENLGIELLPGLVIDPESALTSGSAAAIVIGSYDEHPVVRHFSDLTVFPRTSAIHLQTPKGWQGIALLSTTKTSWLETGRVGETVAFDKGKDIPGPLDLAVTLARTLEKHEQRIVVVANGEFLSNSVIGSAGNLDLGMSLINWLAQNDAYLSIPVKFSQNRRLELSPASALVIGIGFRWALPLAFAVGGVVIWWRRRKR